ncbi:spermine oxidase-like [Malaya genurostris]|uniref:spermine oxidase-like n=1 Tax=Malaya genurostris TaxID=325434 RepID=UPI0026F3D697|nr:spermine oxidase-like [Malaya genurostris]
MRNLLTLSLVSLMAAIGFFVTDTVTIGQDAIVNLPVNVFRKISGSQTVFPYGELYRKDFCATNRVAKKHFLMAAHCFVTDWRVHTEKIIDQSDTEPHQMIDDSSSSSFDSGFDEDLPISPDEPEPSVRTLFEELHEVSDEILRDVPVFVIFIRDVYLLCVTKSKQNFSPRTDNFRTWCLLKRETCITGCDNMDEIDLLELGSYTELQGGNIVLPSGYSSILKPLCDTLPNDSIVLSCPVKTIHWKRKSRPSKTNDHTDTILEEDEDDIDSDDSDKTVTEVPTGDNVGTSDTCEISLKHCTSNVQIVCENGTVYEADHVICTIPLGVLKECGQTMFLPSLPQYKLESIDSLLYGTVDKIILEYDRPFLNAKISEIMFLWEQVDPDPDVDQEEYIKLNWFKKIYSFSKVSDTLLLGWISGKEAAYMESISHEVVAEKCTEILRRFLKDPFIPKPKRCVCTSWNKQPYSRGSYTAIAVGASQDDIENIAQPLYTSPHQAKVSWGRNAHFLKAD